MKPKDQKQPVQQPVQQPAQQPVQQKAKPKSPEKSPPKQSEIAKEQLDQIQKMKQTMMQFQDKFFDTLKKQQDPVAQKLSLRNAERVEDKILNAIRKGVLQLENSKSSVEGYMLDKKVNFVEKEKDMLQSKLQNIDQELNTLKKQKINNPFSAYSQPALKIMQQEENIQKQQEASMIIDKINDEAHTRREKKKKLITEQKQKEQSLQDQRLQKNEEEQQKIKAELQQKLKVHIEELKHKHENRLKEMDKLEEDYFKSLNEKLQKLAKERKHISNLSVPKDQIEPFRVKLEKGQLKKKGISLTPKGDRKADPHIEMERPLYLRIKEEYEKKKKEQEADILQKRKEQIEFKQKYNVDYEEHLVDYEQKLKQKRKEFKQKRQQFLEKLGLKEGRYAENVNASFDSKLWMMGNDSLDMSTLTKERMIEQGKEKRIKIADYASTVKKTIKITKDDEKELENLILKDKLLHPKDYISLDLDQTKDKEERKQKEIELYKSLVEQRQEAEAAQKEKDRLKFEKIKEKAKRDLINEFKKKNIKEEDKEEDEEDEREIPLAIQKGNEYFKDFKTLHISAKEKEKEDREKELEQKKKSALAELKKKKERRLPLIDDPENKKRAIKEQIDSKTLGTLERHDYLSEVKSTHKLEEKRIDQTDWQKVIELDSKKERKMVKNESLPSIRPPTSTDKQSIDYKNLQRKLHNKKVDQIKKKFREENIPEQSTVKRVAEISNSLDAQAHKLEEVAEAQWTTKPLRSVEASSKIDEMYANSIKAKLKVIELTDKKQ